MSIWKQLYKTYDVIAQRDDAKDLGNVDKYLLRDGLSTFKMSVEVTLNDNGEFVDATLVPDSDMATIIPTTNSSVARTSGISAHPLFDTLEYLANDWSNYVTDNDFVENALKKHFNYLNILEKWRNNTQFKQVKILYKFIKNNNLLQLLLSKINFKEIKNIKENEEPDYTKLASYTVRFRVGSEMPNEMWKNQALYEEWSNKYCEILGEPPLKEEISYINGEKESLFAFIPKYIRYPGDGAKLISANDTTIRTFGGRFKPSEPNQAVTIGHNSLLKSLYALKWLIKNQGFSYDDLVILTWSVENVEEDNPYNYKYDEDLWENMDDVQHDTLNSESNKVIKSVGYYGQYSKSLEKLKESHLVNVAAFDTSTKGRLAICYYNEFDSEKYYSNIIVGLIKLNGFLKKKIIVFYERRPLRKYLRLVIHIVI